MSSIDGHRLVIVTNIPSPYRLHLFEHLYRIMRPKGLSLEVMFMAETEPWRYWSFDSSRWGFPHKVHWGLHPYWRGIPFHINPTILYDVWRRPPNWLMLGGSWAMPTTALLAVSPRWAGPRCLKLWWLEANERSMKYRTGLVAWLRNWIVSRADALVLPGKIAQEWADSSLKVQLPKIWLPNVVDEGIYRDRVEKTRVYSREIREKYKIPQNEIVALLPSRLAPEKNIVGLLKAISEDWPKGLRLLIAGDGPLYHHIAELIKQTDRVKMLGYQDTERMIELFAISDLVILPSLRDPNPLVIIEALWAGLPVLASINVGNWPEAIEPGRNGWLFDPTQPQEMRKAVLEAVAVGRDGLRVMGMRSREIAYERFETSTVVHRFLDQLLNLS
jgi:glycosyltransferase involved in cell wall biosynthesis